VTTAISLAKPSTCSASFSKKERGMKCGNRNFRGRSPTDRRAGAGSALRYRSPTGG
jgi:hypothetical protein